MSEPKRYICKVVNTCCDHMDACLSVKHSRKEAPEGEYVRYEDYARLKAQVERLTKAGDGLHQACRRFWYLSEVCKAWNAAKEGKQP